jgi:2-keto-4-pentenoate hydratase/2-oxohepta-3-ene-1,7-dioic acid hydratase in catechol pathway
VVVTPDELGGTTDRPRAAMRARVNGEVWSQGDADTLHFGVGTLIAHAARDSVVRAGDVIGSGTVTEGCILELMVLRPDSVHWLGPGDVVELQIENIGTLRHTIVRPRRREEVGGE